MYRSRIDTAGHCCTGRHTLGVQIILDEKTNKLATDGKEVDILLKTGTKINNKAKIARAKNRKQKTEHKHTNI